MLVPWLAARGLRAREDRAGALHESPAPLSSVSRTEPTAAAALARIDAAAQRTGVSRNVLLRELPARYADEQTGGDLTDEQVTAFRESVGDLLDEDRRRAAWRR